MIHRIHRFSIFAFRFAQNRFRSMKRNERFTLTGRPALAFKHEQQNETAIFSRQSVPRCRAPLHATSQLPTIFISVSTRIRMRLWCAYAVPNCGRVLDSSTRAPSTMRNSLPFGCGKRLSSIYSLASTLEHLPSRHSRASFSWIS